MGWVPIIQDPSRFRMTSRYCFRSPQISLAHRMLNFKMAAIQKSSQLVLCQDYSECFWSNT